MDNVEDENKQVRINNAIEKYHTKLSEYKKEIIEDFKEFKEDKIQLKVFKQKYPFLKIRKDTKEETIYNYNSSIIDFITKDDNNPIGKYKFSDEEKELIIVYCIKKIRGIYKMAQSMKTGYCNSIIMNSVSKKNITFAITKNTLEANEQWLVRIMKDLDNRFPLVSKKDKVMIISSRKNDLGGNATHCKNISDAWMLLSKENNYSVIFVCSNGKRIGDIYSIIENISRLRDDFKKKVDVIHDEAHNPREGIPPFRETIENIIVHPLVETYIPCTASIGRIVEENNPLWGNSNLTKYAKNFTEFDETKSDDPNYSSISDSKRVTFEELSKLPDWEDIVINEVSRELFIKCDDKYSSKIKNDITDDEWEDIDKRRQLEFSIFQVQQQEKKAICYGINALNMNKLLKIEYFQKDIFNLHIISTPCRKIITRYLAGVAGEEEYNPIILSIYGSEGDKYHLFYDGIKRKCNDIMKNGTFNDKVLKVINHLKAKGVNTERPFIIIGNYYPTGESLSFVHSEYGTVKGNIRLISTTAEEDYQGAARSNYMLNKFKEDNGVDWKQPEKWLIGEKTFIYNSELYEKDNDERLDNLKNENVDTHNIHDDNPIVNVKSHNTDIGGEVACPIKFEIDGDDDDENIEQLREIMTLKTRTKECKKIFMKCLEQAVKDETISMSDPYQKFDFKEFTLVDFRCFGVNGKGGNRDKNNLSKNWKFGNYESHHKSRTSFMNNKNKHEKKQCELLCSSKLFKDKNSKGETIKNSKQRFWIGYKY